METKERYKNPDSNSEQRYYGRRVCHAIFDRRPEDIISVRLDKALTQEFGQLLRWCAENRKAYQLLDREQLDNLSKSAHHEGVVLLAKKRPVYSDEDFQKALESEGFCGLIVALDGVENPHNLGAILRNCANFGVGTILTADPRLLSLSSATCRVSEGGSECVDVFRVENLSDVLSQLKKRRFITVGTSSKAKAGMFAHNFASNTCVVLGSESHGLSKDVQKVVDLNVRIPGTEKVQSLNVAAASAVLLAEFWRQHQNS